MTDKSYVTLEQQCCIVCGKTFDTGSILMDRRLRNTFEHHTVTGWGMCPEHQKLKDDGFTALVEIDEKKTTDMNNPYRTGCLAHVRNEVWENIFDTPLPPKGVCFVEIGVLAKLQTLVPDEGQTP